MLNTKHLLTPLLLTAGLFAFEGASQASSHREAPQITEDPTADNTDVYVFISPTDPDRLVMVANYVPLLIPESGPNFYRFSDHARYEIRVDNDGDARPDVTFRYRFRTAVNNGQTFLYNTGPVASVTDPNLNVRQTYDLIRIDHRPYRRQFIARDVPVAPWHVGKRSFPNDSYESVARQAIYDAGDVKTFAGPRDEPFFVDLHVFDLLGVGGAPTTDGLNVMSLVLELPITALTKDGVRPSDATTSESVLGIYARATRRRLTLRGNKRNPRSFGSYVQVSRLAVPLVNEVLVPLGDKDKYNRTNPVKDVANFGPYILDPELPKLLNAVLGLNCPDTPAEGRVDIVGILSPNGTTPADLLRINVATGQTYANTAFPNGRKLSDDVTDTLLTVLCANGGPVGDGVDANDLPFSDTFPYLASPHSGNR